MKSKSFNYEGMIWIKKGSAGGAFNITNQLENDFWIF